MAVVVLVVVTVSVILRVCMAVVVLSSVSQTVWINVTIKV
jgi:hypothetical protein